jgi:hypothetical protein
MTGLLFSMAWIIQATTTANQTWPSKIQVAKTIVFKVYSTMLSSFLNLWICRSWFCHTKGGRQSIEWPSLKARQFNVSSIRMDYVCLLPRHIWAPTSLNKYRYRYNLLANYCLEYSGDECCTFSVDLNMKRRAFSIPFQYLHTQCSVSTEHRCNCNRAWNDPMPCSGVLQHHCLRSEGDVWGMILLYIWIYHKHSPPC